MGLQISELFKAFVFTLCMGIVHFLVWALGDRLGKAMQAVRRSYGNHVMPVQLPCSLQIANGNRTALLWALYRGHTEMVQ